MPNSQDKSPRFIIVDYKMHDLFLMLLSESLVHRNFTIRKFNNVVKSRIPFRANIYFNQHLNRKNLSAIELDLAGIDINLYALKSSQYSHFVSDDDLRFVSLISRPA